MACDFSFDHYQETLAAYAKEGYALVSFEDYLLKKPEQAVILRHDIDFALDTAIDMHVREQFYTGATATYFVRLHAKNYNALSAKSIAIWKLILRYGGRIGLHFEPGMAGVIETPPKELLFRDLRMLGGVLGRNVKGISQHHWPNRIDFDKYLQATNRYDTAWFMSLPTGPSGTPGVIKYLSDSGGRWREGCFCKWLGRVPLLHVCTHPVWWYHDTPEESY